MKVKELAAALNVSRQSIATWKRQGCPMESIEAARQWRENRKRPRRGVARDPGETAQARILAAQADKLEQEAFFKRMKNDQLAGKLYDAEEVERNVGELTSMIRCRLEAIPDEMELELPPESRLQIKQRIADKIYLILTSLAQWRLPCEAQEQEADELDPAAGESGDDTELYQS